MKTTFPSADQLLLNAGDRFGLHQRQKVLVYCIVHCFRDPILIFIHLTLINSYNSTCCEQIKRNLMFSDILLKNALHCQRPSCNAEWVFFLTSQLCRLQVQTLPDATPPIVRIRPFSKMTVTFEPLMRVLSSLGFRKFFIPMA